MPLSSTIMASTTTLLNPQPGSDPPVEGQACPVNTQLPSACAINLKDKQSGEGSGWTATTQDHGASRSQQDSDEASHNHVESTDSQPSHGSTDLSISDCRPYLQSRQSSSSLASSINTIIHLGSSTIVEPTPTSQLVQGSIIESGSDSSKLLNQLAAQSAPNAQPSDTADDKNSKIQFHNVVRISGGISSSPKRKRTSKQAPPRNISIPVDPHRSVTLDPPRSNTPRSPLGTGSFENRSPPSYPHLMNSPHHHHHHHHHSPPESRLARPGEIIRFETTSDSSSSSARRSFRSNKQGTLLRPGPPSTRSSFSRRSRTASASPSGINNRYAPPGTHPPSKVSYPRTSSMSSSIAGSGNYAATIISRSSSPASSLYLPLRVPVARAPAPFFGPTPERVARVRERRQVAQRDAERAKGGWKAWWNNLYYQSDRFATRKGKGKQDSSSNAPPHDHHSGYDSQCIEDGDSDDGSCYHDVILEHERKKLERKLSKLRRLKQMEASMDRRSGRQDSAAHHHRKRRANSEKVGPKPPQSWLSWASSIIVGLPPSPVHPLLLPSPGSGILRRPKLTTSPLLPGKPVLPIISEPSADDSPPSCYVTAPPETDSRTCLLSQPAIVSYGSLAPQPSVAGAETSCHTKTPTEVRFGSAPRRWISFAWWAWKVQTLCLACYLGLKSKLVDLFHIDWDTDERRYEGWENV